eukprot:NODE_11270_length_1297_cov_6.830769.p1 GENE.NODE_11270_length_1297_cov_6.830769~~NODE_11270_length_1297_cov_6.830769.p1  ORF type:complete len:312 (-),score=53.34 NODE_11270_length_1297_cov_6.830769:263-1198(-)
MTTAAANATTAPKYGPVPTEDASAAESKQVKWPVFVDHIGEYVKKGEDEPLPIPGNLYSYWAFEAFAIKHKVLPKDSSVLRGVGLLCIAIIQIVGPVAIFFWAWFELDMAAMTIGLGEFEYKFGSGEQGISNLTKQALGTMFLFLFNLYGVYSLRKQGSVNDKLWEIATFCKDNNSVVKRRWIFVGAFMNVFCIIGLSVCMWPLFELADSPKDVLFDALGLMFLYHLDDIDGELGFISDRWDATFYGMLHLEVTGIHMSNVNDSLLTCPRTPVGWVFKVGEVFMGVLCFVVPFILNFLEGTIRFRLKHHQG